MSHRRFTLRALTLAASLAVVSACSSSTSGGAAMQPSPGGDSPMAMSRMAPTPDPRVGLPAAANGQPAAEAIWNLRKLSTTPPGDQFKGATNADLTFTGKYVIQGNYNGPEIWDISDPRNPVLAASYFCPASQNDVSVYRNLLFVSSESNTGRLDCEAGGAPGPVSHDRMRGIRIFDISDVTNPVYIHSVQTCRGSHTHTVLASPRDTENVYVYVSGSAGVRPAEELPGCSALAPEEDPNSALFRIEVIKVPLADPTKAAIVSSPRIFEDLDAPPQHGASPADLEANRQALAAARARGAFTVDIQGTVQVLPDGFARGMLDSLVRLRNGSGDPTTADSAKLRADLPALIARLIGGGGNRVPRGPSQCHDITVYPAIGLAGGACGGYGLLLDISDPANPRRIDAVADSNFSYWHSATFNNDGTKVLFTDEWGGGGAPKCRPGDPKEWGANAYFTIEDRKMHFKGYWKLPADQTELENCVAHNGSLIPIPGRDVMVQGWYQGGISVFDWTDPSNVVEIAYHDRGPINAESMGNAGSWSVYWYNGLIVSSEIGLGLDIFELTPSGWLSANEIAAAKTVVYDEFNAQGQPRYEFPPSFALARAYLDQLQRSGGLAGDKIATARGVLDQAEGLGEGNRRSVLSQLANALIADAQTAKDQRKVRTLATTVTNLVGVGR
jgi:hypothetical protein